MKNLRWLAILAFLVLAVSQVCADDFEFAWVTDTHVVTTSPVGKDYDRTIRLREVLADMGTSSPDFIFHGGDSVEKPGDPQQAAAFDQAMRTEIRWYPIPGNHDIGNSPTSKTLEAWAAAGRGRGEQNREFYGFIHKGAAFFVLNTFVNESTDTEMIARAGAQLSEMDRFFATHPEASPKIVCGHAPLFIKDAAEPNEYFNVKSPYRGKLIETMRRHGADTYLAGHRHGDYVVESGGIREYCQTALSFQIGEGNRPGWYMFGVRNGKLTRVFQPLDLARIDAKAQTSISSK